MKKLFLTASVLIVLLLTCIVISCKESGAEAEIDAFIIFDNSRGANPISVYSSQQRNSRDRITELNAGERSRPIEWASSPFNFFFLSYTVGLTGIDNFILNVPRSQINPRVDKGTTTNVILPSFAEAFRGYDGLLTNSSHLVIQNNSTFPLEVHQSTFPLRPDNNSASPMVSARESAQYTITPGLVSGYQLWTGGRFVPFPASIENFREGFVYNFTYDENNITLINSVEANVANVRFAQ